jgi:hypothetical protein
MSTPVLELTREETCMRTNLNIPRNNTVRKQAAAPPILRLKTSLEDNALVLLCCGSEGNECTANVVRFCLSERYASLFDADERRFLRSLLWHGSRRLSADETARFGDLMVRAMKAKRDPTHPRHTVGEAKP